MRWLSSLIVVPPIILLARRLLICYNYWWFQPGHSTWKLLTRIHWNASEIWASVDLTSRHPFFSYSLFLAIDWVRLGEVTRTKCTTHSICFLDFQKVMARTFYVFYLPPNSLIIKRLLQDSMILKLMDIQECYGHTNDFPSNSIGHICIR